MDTELPAKKSDVETLNFIGEKEYEGIKRSDVVIVLTPQVKQLIGNTEDIADELMTETYCDICGKKCAVKPYDKWEKGW